MGPIEGRPVGSLKRGGRSRKDGCGRGEYYGESSKPPSDCMGYAIFERTGGDNAMADEQQPTSGNRELTAQIVAAYIRRNPVAADALPALISSVHEALGRLGTPSGEPVIELTPAVSIRRSVTRDFVVCMECGWKCSMVRRHLATRHGLTADEYRARWNLPADHPMTAPAYSERRSTMAKEIGLGRGRSIATAAVPEMDQPTQPAPKRRGRSRSAATPA
jgi:predicted transcriptional regulator